MSAGSIAAADDRLAALLEREAIRDIIGRTALLLDREDLPGWLALFAPEAEYEISAYSPEIKSLMSWWKSDNAELRRIVLEIPNHVRDPGRRMHLVTPISIDISAGRATAVSQFAVFRTAPEGDSRVYALGRYEDDLVKESGGWLYRKHRAILDTRMLEVFTHLPL